MKLETIEREDEHGMLNPLGMEDDALVGVWRQRFGRSAWHVLHTMIAHFSVTPSTPSTEERTKMLQVRGMHCTHASARLAPLLHLCTMPNHGRAAVH